ncbi:MAG TPA: nitroreductase family protein [Candidatus Bathyarchaeia archaeon]|nr:nitroreductase family protein [Candidatus Bathyarchaeia archaeon]
MRALIDAARLAPSGSNAQPWRFKIVTDEAKRVKLAEAAYGQSFVAQAPLVLVCCADIQGYFTGTASGIQDLEKAGAVETSLVRRIRERAEGLRTMKVEEVIPRIVLNVGIAVEHIALRALDFGLGSCWVRMIDEQKIKDIFRWGNAMHVVALLPLGYPDEAPSPRTRRSIEEILLA